MISKIKCQCCKELFTVKLLSIGGSTTCKHCNKKIKVTDRAYKNICKIMAVFFVIVTMFIYDFINPPLGISNICFKVIVFIIVIIIVAILERQLFIYFANKINKDKNNNDGFN